MAKYKWTLESALKRAENGGAVIGDKKIDARNCGIGTQGAVDFLCKFCGYVRN